VLEYDVEYKVVLIIGICSLSVVPLDSLDNAETSKTEDRRRLAVKYSGIA
jgi:hypothetical protein